MAQRRRRRVTTVTRGDAAEKIDREDEVSVGAQLLDLKEPQFLSLVKAPANRTPFKIVRDDTTTKTRRRRTADPKALMTVTLPEGITMEEAEEVFQRFGLSADEFAIEAGEDDRIRYVRKKREDGIKTVPINMGQGIIAHIEAASLTRGIEPPPDHPGLTVLRFDFESREVGESWLTEHNLSIEEGKWLELEESAIFMRHDMMPPDGAKEITVDGVVATIAQTRQDDIPVVIYRQVIEEAYGNHGWGMIDFNQAMADMQFTRDAQEANRMLWDVLDNILFYSMLPMADRQALIMNALNQFAVWLTNLMSALPREMTDPDNRIDLNSQGDGGDNAARSDNDPPEETKETADMPKGKEQVEAQGAEQKETVERQDATDESQEVQAEAEETQVERQDNATEESATEEAQEDAEKVFTRSEAEEIARSAVEAALAKKEQAQRQDADPIAVMSSAFEKVLAPVVQRMDDLTRKVDEVQKTTVVREDSMDDVQESDSEDEVQREDPFRGTIFPGLYRSKR